MRKQLTGEPVAGKPHTGFGGRGRRSPFPTPILRPLGDVRQQSSADVRMTAPPLAAATRTFCESAERYRSNARGTNEIGVRNSFELSIGLLDTQRARRATFADQRIAAHDAVALDKDFVAPLFGGCLNVVRFAGRLPTRGSGCGSLEAVRPRSRAAMPFHTTPANRTALTSQQTDCSLSAHACKT